MPMVAVLTLHADASTASWLQVALTLPFVLFAIPIGMLADRWSKHTLMAGAEAVRAVVLFVVAGLLVALAGFALQLLCILQSPAVRLVRRPKADDADTALKPA